MRGRTPAILTALLLYISANVYAQVDMHDRSIRTPAHPTAAVRRSADTSSACRSHRTPAAAGGRQARDPRTPRPTPPPARGRRDRSGRRGTARSNQSSRRTPSPMASARRTPTARRGHEWFPGIACVTSSLTGFTPSRGQRRAAARTRRQISGPEEHEAPGELARIATLDEALDGGCLTRSGKGLKDARAAG